MKKLLVLSVLLGLMALPMFASDITFGGDATFGFIGDFGDVEDEEWDLTLDIKVAIDDYNSAVIELNSLENGSAQPEKALVTTDVGAWLGLPVGLVVNWGWDDPDANEFAVVTEYENEQVYDLSPDEYWGLDFLISYNIIEVELAFNPTATTPSPSDAVTAGYLLAGLAVKEPIPGLNAEVYWFQGLSAFDEFDQGGLCIGAAYSTEVSGIGLDVGTSFAYDMADLATVEWFWGLGAAVSVSMFDITLGVNGYDGQTLDDVTASVAVAPVDMVSLYAGMYLTFDDAFDTFQGADIGVNPHIGAVEMYLGYWITENGVGDLEASEMNTPLDGGMYVKFDVDY